MSEVVKMLEGDGLPHRWEEWPKHEISRQVFSRTHISYHNSITPYSYYNPSAEQLSGSR